MPNDPSNLLYFIILQTNKSIIRTMLNTSPQSHVVRVKILIKKLYLKVRFPCSISIQVKNQINYTQTKSIYPLKDGEAIINQSVQLELQADFNPNRSSYQDKNVSLIVYMSSTNGKVVAGSLKFNIFSKNIGMTSQFSSVLQKCPDKAAKINFSSVTQFVRSNSRIVDKSTYSYINDLKHLSPRILDNAIQNNHSGHVSGHINGNGHVSPMKNTMYVSDRKYQQQQQNQYQFKNNMGIKKQPKYNRNYDQMSISPAKTHQAFNPTTNYRGSQAESQVVFRHTEGRSIQKYQDKYNNYNNNYETQQKQRKMVTKVKTQLNYKHMQDINTYQNKITKMKTQNQHLFREIQMYKQNAKVLERKQKNYLISIKELKQDIQKRKNKTLESNQKATDFQRQLAEKQKIYKALEQQKKSLQQTIQRINIQRRTHQKKSQLRTSTLADQLKRLQQKYKQSQLQRQTSVQEYNTILNKLQQSQKKQQILLKQKQKKHFEQKTKQNKKIESLTQKILSMETTLQDKNENIDHIANQKKCISKKQSQKEVIIMNLQSQVDSISLNLRKQEENKVLLQQSIQNYKKIEQQKNSLKRRFSQQILTLQSLNQTKLKLQLHVQQSDHKISELQKLLKQKQTQKNSLQAKFDHLKKDSQNFIVKYEQLQKQKQNLQNLLKIQNKKTQEFKLKYDGQKRNLQDMQDQFQTKLQRMLRLKDQLQKDLQQARWSIQKTKDNYQQLNYQYKLSNTQILTLNQQILTLSDKQKKLQDQSTQQKIRNDNMKYDLEQYKKKQKQSTLLIKQKQDQIYQLKKKKQQLQQELYLSKDKFVHTDLTYKDKLSLEQKKYKEKDLLLGQKYDELSHAESKILALSDEIAYVRQNVSLLTKDSQSLKILNDDLRTHLETLQTNQYLNLQKLQASQRMVRQLQTSVRSKDDLLARSQKALKKLQQQFDQYKQNIVHSLQHLLSQLSKDQQKNVGIITSTTLKSIIDPKISKLQIELIQKRNTTILKYRQRMYQYEEEINSAKNQLKKLQKKLYQTERVLEQTLKQEKQKVQTILIDRNSERFQLQSQVKILQEKNLQKMIQIQKLNNELNTQESFVQQHKAQIYILITQYESLKAQNHDLQQKIQKLRQNQIKEKSIQEHKLAQISQAYEQILERLRANSLQLQKQILSLSRELSQKMDHIKKVENEVRSQCFSKQKQQQRGIELVQKLKTSQKSKQESQKKHKQQEKQLKKLATMIDQQIDIITNQKIKYQDLQIQNKRLSQQLLQVQLLTQRQKQQLSSSNQKSTELQLLFKSKTQTSKSQIQKYLSQIKQLKDRTINLTSEVELKSFVIKKAEETSALLREQIEKLSNQLIKRKMQNRLLFENNQKIKKQSLQMEEKLQSSIQQNNQLTYELQSKQSTISSLKVTTHQMKNLQQELQRKDRQLFRLKQQKILAQQNYQNSNQKLRSQLKQYKADLTNTVYRQEQYKKKSKQLQRILQIQNNDLYMERKKWSSDNERQKQAIYKRVQQLEEAKDNLEQEYKFQRIQLNKEIQTLTKQYNSVINELRKNQSLNQQLQQRLQQVQRKLKDTTLQLQKTLSSLTRQKQKVQNLQKHLQSNKTTFQKLQKKYFSEVESSQRLMKNILEQIDKQKQKTIQKVSSSSLSNIVSEKSFLLDFEQFLRKSYKNLQNFTQQLLDKKNQNRYKNEEYFSISYPN